MPPPLTWDTLCRLMNSLLLNVDFSTYLVLGLIDFFFLNLQPWCLFKTALHTCSDAVLCCDESITLENCVLFPFILLSGGYIIKFLCCSYSMQIDKNPIFEEMKQRRLKISCSPMTNWLKKLLKKSLWGDTSVSLPVSDQWAESYHLLMMISLWEKKITYMYFRLYCMHAVSLIMACGLWSISASPVVKV